MKMQEKYKKCRAGFVCGINLSDKTQAGNCEPDVSEKDDMEYTIST